MDNNFTAKEKAKIASSVAFRLSERFETNSNLMTMDPLFMSKRDKVLKERAAFCAAALEKVLIELIDYNDEEIEKVINEFVKNSI